MTYYITESIKSYLKSIDELYSVIYTDSGFDITSQFVISPQSNIVSPSKTFIMLDNEDGVALTSSISDYFIGWAIEYTGGTYNKYVPITAYNNLTGQVSILEALDSDVTSSDTLNMSVSNSIFVECGNEFDSYIKQTATESKLPIYLRIQSRQDGNRENIRHTSQLIKSDLLGRMKKRLPIYDSVGDVCGYMKILSSVDVSPSWNDGEQIQMSIMSFTVSYTMNYKK